MSIKEKKRLRTIRKAINIVENITLFISFMGVMGLIVVVSLAPLIIENGGSYYIGLVGSLAAIFAAPALAWIEDEIKKSGKDKEK